MSTTVRSLFVNAGIYLASAVVGAVFSSAMAYAFTAYGDAPGSWFQAVAGGAMFLLAALVLLGLPIAVAMSALITWLSVRRPFPRAALIGVALVGGLLWLGISFGAALRTYASPAALTLLAPWLLFGLFVRPQWRSSLARDIQQR
jgi:hypothetical protein